MLFTHFTVDQSKLTVNGSVLSDTPNVRYLVALYRNIICWLEWLQLDPHCRASFDSKSFAKVDVTDGQRDESRALPVLLHKTCASYCHIVVVVVSGIQPTPIA